MARNKCAGDFEVLAGAGMLGATVTLQSCLVWRKLVTPNHPQDRHLPASKEHETRVRVGMGRSQLSVMASGIITPE